MTNSCPLALLLLSILSGVAISEEKNPNPDDVQTACDLVGALDTTIKRPSWSSHLHGDSIAFEQALMQIIELGPAAESPLSKKILSEEQQLIDVRQRLENLSFEDKGFWAAHNEVDRLSNNTELLTALRRIQGHPDPLQIRVTQPNTLKAIPGRLPIYSVELVSHDIEQKSIWAQLIPHYHGTRRQAQWRFEVRNEAGTVLPVRANENMFRFGGGIKSDGWLPFGEILETELALDDYVEINKPGRYSVTILYHSKYAIADLTDNDVIKDLIIYRSPTFELTVQPGTKLVVESNPEVTTLAAEYISNLPTEGVVKVVRGVYDEDDYGFVPADSAMGKLLLLNWKAVPALLDSLQSSELSVHQKSVVLSLLYTITMERTLAPNLHWDAFPDCDIRSGKREYVSFVTGKRQVDPEKQASLIQKWLRYREDYLEIR
ncbi:MAG: hypothetical protein R3C18_25165 [Planctomycetaceae bacterium]